MTVILADYARDTWPLLQNALETVVLAVGNFEKTVIWWGA